MRACCVPPASRAARRGSHGRRRDARRRVDVTRPSRRGLRAARLTGRAGRTTRRRDARPTRRRPRPSRRCLRAVRLTGRAARVARTPTRRAAASTARVRRGATRLGRCDRDRCGVARASSRSRLRAAYDRDSLLAQAPWLPVELALRTAHNARVLISWARYSASEPSTAGAATPNAVPCPARRLPHIRRPDDGRH